MKSKLIITCVCLGMLGSTLSCAGDEEATTVNAESASPQSDSDNDQDTAAKPAKKKKAEKKVAGSVDRDKMTNADCFPDRAPDSAPDIAKTCISLAKSAPDMLFTLADYSGMPEDCKPIVLPECR